MARAQVKSYQRAPQPANPDSYRLYLENELRRLQETLASMQAAIVQLQTASSLPIPP